MKRCPNCNQSFSDDLVFCLHDGTVLETSSGASYSGDTPTQVFTSLPTKSVEKTETNKSFYAIIGVMAVVIIGLAAVVFFLMSGAKDDKNEENKTVENKSPNVAQTSPTTNQTIEKIEKTPLPITKEAAQNLINRWEQAQDARNFDAYRSCYGQPFLGIKRTKSGSETRMNYAQWMNDRQKMLKNIIDVGVENLNITIEGDTANAQFIQQFQSENYEDTGQKTMRIKMFEGGAKIVYEELKYVY